MTITGYEMKAGFLEIQKVSLDVQIVVELCIQTPGFSRRLVP